MLFFPKAAVAVGVASYGFGTFTSVHGMHMPKIHMAKQAGWGSAEIEAPRASGAQDQEDDGTDPHSLFQSAVYVQNASDAVGLAASSAAKVTAAVVDEDGEVKRLPSQAAEVGTREAIHNYSEATRNYSEATHNHSGLLTVSGFSLSNATAAASDVGSKIASGVKVAAAEMKREFGDGQLGSPWASVEQTSFVKALSTQSAKFMNDMRSIQAESATMVNRTGVLWEQMTAESKNRQAGASHMMFPGRHVVKRCVGGACAGRAAAPRAGRPTARVVVTEAHSTVGVNASGNFSSLAGLQESEVAKAPAALDAFDAEAELPAYVQDEFGAGYGHLLIALGALAIVVATSFVSASRKQDNKQHREVKTASRTDFLRQRHKLPSRDPEVYQRELADTQTSGAHHSHFGGCSDQRLGVWDGTVALFSSVVGTGLLAMPYAFSLAGMIAVPVVIFFVCCSAYTAHLMSWLLHERASEGASHGAHRSTLGWGFLVELAFGARAKSCINAFLIVELWGYLISCTLCAALNVAQIADVGVRGAVGISVVTAYALTFVPGRLLTKVNVFANVFFVITMVMFLVTGLMLPSKAWGDDVEFVKPRGIVLAAGILVFSPAGHSFFPSIMQRMEEPDKFPICVRRGYSAACVLYIAVAVLGYYFFGHAVQPSAVRNIGADLSLSPLPNLGWMNSWAAIGMVTKMMGQQPLILMPLTSTLEGVVSNGDRALLDPVTAKVLVTPCLLLTSALVAVLFANEMAMLLNLLGSVFCMTIAFVVPVLCYWRLATEPLGFAQRVAFVSLVFIGLSFAVLGVLTAL